MIVLLKTSESFTLHNEIKHNDYIIKPKLTGNVCNTGKHGDSLINPGGVSNTDVDKTYINTFRILGTDILVGKRDKN